MVALIVDDDPLIRSLLTQLLRLRGFSTAAASSLAEAGGSIGQAQPSPDLLVVDSELPDGDGFVWVRGAAAHMPQVKVILSSGWPIALDQVAPELTGRAFVLQKPYQAGDLFSILDEAGLGATGLGKKG